MACIPTITTQPPPPNYHLNKLHESKCTKVQLFKSSYAQILHFEGYSAKKKLNNAISLAN